MSWLTQLQHETSSIFTLEHPFRGARQRLRSKLGGLDCSTWLSVDGLLGFPASSNVLTTFAQADALFEYTASGTRLKPLALMFAEALEAPTADVRYQLLRRLGDISLFVAGFLAESFARKPIDIDYLCAQRKGHPSPLRGVAEDRKPPGA